MAQSKETIEAREALLKEKGISIDENILKNAGEAKFNEAVEAAELEKKEPKERKARAPKVDPASPKGILMEKLSELTDTQSHVVTNALKKHFKEPHPNTEADPESLDVQAHNAIHARLHK